MLDMHIGLFTLLKEFDAICRKHGVTYYLEGGSLLGAVRHKGFLPWDDDVDLCITRDNFMKLLSVIDGELPANRELYCYERFPGYLRDTVKYTNLDSTVIFPNHILDGNACGQHIDLFILDPAPSDPKEQEEFKALACVYSELMTPVYVMCDDIANHMDIYNHYHKMMEEKGRDYTLNLLREKLFTREDDENCDTYLLRWGNRHVYYKKAFFGEPVEVMFEGHSFPAPSQFYRFLRAEFGDSWMIVPDTAHQEDHSTFDNYHIPCKVFQADYIPFINFEKAWDRYSQRKRYNLENLKNKVDIQRNNATMQFILSKIDLEDRLQALSAAQLEMLDKEDYTALAASFDDYYNAQIHTEIHRFGMALPVAEPVLYAAALALVMTGRFGEAEKLIRAQGENASCISDRIRDLSLMITDIRSCMLAREEGRHTDAYALAEKWYSRFPLQLNLAAVCIQKGLLENRDTAALLATTRSLLNFYPGNDTLLMLAGKLLEKEGCQKEADAYFRSCAKVTRNGLLLMELQAIRCE